MEFMGVGPFVFVGTVAHDEIESRVRIISSHRISSKPIQMGNGGGEPRRDEASRMRVPSRRTADKHFRSVVRSLSRKQTD